MFGILKNLWRIGKLVSEFDNEVAPEDLTLEEFCRLFTNFLVFLNDRRKAFTLDWVNCGLL